MTIAAAPTAAQPASKAAAPARTLPRLLIEDWLPAAAIGVECMRERGSASALAPHTYLHVWWARRPLTVARAAVLASLLPADFPRDTFETLLGFGKPGDELVQLRALMDSGYRVPGGFNCDRAFKANIPPKALDALHAATAKLWGDDIVVIDPMAGGGSIPLESARMGFKTLANEYNPVACSVLEATVDYPFRYGAELATKARKWAKVWLERIEKRLAPFYPEHPHEKVHAYIFARTVPCPDTGFDTPLVPDWHLLKPKTESGQTVAVPVVDNERGTWTVAVKMIGRGAGYAKEPPKPTYGKGNGVSLFSNNRIDGDYIKAMAKQGRLKCALYAIAYKTLRGLEFRPPTSTDLDSVTAAEAELNRVRPDWERTNVLPTESLNEVSNYDRGHRLYGKQRWADLFTPRQLLAAGTVVQEFRGLQAEVSRGEGQAVGNGVEALLACILDKFLNHNSIASRWDTSTGVIKGIFDRHGYAFRPTGAELAPCAAGSGFAWATDNVCEAFENIARLPRSDDASPPEITAGSATSLPAIGDKSVTAVVVDPPYADNVQYSEMADFFYVWLKRTRGLQRPDWFSTLLTSRDEEAVVNLALHRLRGATKGKQARSAANAHYQMLMAKVFGEARRILRDDGILTVMFTHKKQEAWESLFDSLIHAGFTINATWPVKTESEHGLHQAKKNAAQSTVILVSRKRADGTGVGYWDEHMKSAIRMAARDTAARLKGEGLNAVDQLVGSFGPAMHVFSAFDEVRTDTGTPVGVDAAIDEAADAVSRWRIEQLAARGLDGVEAEGRFALLCWDVLGAAEFRFNEAKLLGNAVGMDVDQLAAAGLVSKTGDKIKILSAAQRRRERALTPQEYEATLFGREAVKGKRRTKKDVLRVHPNDPNFRTALDGCHAIALRFAETPGGPAASTGAAKQLVRQQGWEAESAVAKLMVALVNAAPEAVRHEGGARSAAAAFPEFRAWHGLLQPLFGIEPPDWTVKQRPQGELFGAVAEPAEAEDEADPEEGEADGDEAGDDE
jgi:putative DNA methylase